MQFTDLQINNVILKNVARQGYETPSPIQAQAIPPLLEGNDMLASAQTGTGKTAAFAIPIINSIAQKQFTKRNKKMIKALILAPTRELAIQIKDSITIYATNLGLKTTTVYGGVSKRNQIVALKRGIDILVATPGRLLDLMNMKLVDLSHLEHFVLDEADRMLDMGFIIDVKKIVKSIPSTRQTMLFSATLPHEIIALADMLLTNPIRIEIIPEKATLETIKQRLFYVNQKHKIDLLMNVLREEEVTSALIFCRTKHTTSKLADKLILAGFKADAIHGNKSQMARQQALKAFKLHKIDVLVATDIAARGIDIDALSHVINYDVPETPEAYIHRIGRTARASLSGHAYTFAAKDERHLVKAIERHIKETIEEEKTHAFVESFNQSVEPKKSKRNPRQRTRNPKAKDKSYTVKEKAPKPLKQAPKEMSNRKKKKKQQRKTTEASPFYKTKAKNYAIKRHQSKKHSS